MCERGLASKKEENLLTPLASLLQCTLLKCGNALKFIFPTSFNIAETLKTSMTFKSEGHRYQHIIEVFKALM